MDSSEVIGICAGIFTAISLIPQLIKIYKERTGGNTSIGMLAILFIGLVLWIIYGALKKDLPIIATNSTSLFINTWIMILQYKYRNKSSNDGHKH